LSREYLGSGSSSIGLNDGCQVFSSLSPPPAYNKNESSSEEEAIHSIGGSTGDKDDVGWSDRKSKLVMIKPLQG